MILFQVIIFLNVIIILRRISQFSSRLKVIQWIVRVRFYVYLLILLNYLSIIKPPIKPCYVLDCKKKRNKILFYFILPKKTEFVISSFDLR